MDDTHDVTAILQQFSSKYLSPKKPSSGTPERYRGDGGSSRLTPQRSGKSDGKETDPPSPMQQLFDEAAVEQAKEAEAKKARERLADREMELARERQRERARQAETVTVASAGHPATPEQVSAATHLAAPRPSWTPSSPAAGHTRSPQSRSPLTRPAFDSSGPASSVLDAMSPPRAHLPQQQQQQQQQQPSRSHYQPSSSTAAPPAPSTIPCRYCESSFDNIVSKLAAEEKAHEATARAAVDDANEWEAVVMRERERRKEEVSRLQRERERDTVTARAELDRMAGQLQTEQTRVQRERERAEAAEALLGEERERISEAERTARTRAVALEGQLAAARGSLQALQTELRRVTTQRDAEATKAKEVMDIASSLMAQLESLTQEQEECTRR